ncbi:MAG: hypothetical protein EHM40_20470 [Chloroflexi bacterium]|nr:MAG: hypothetical protein EHM40_20470 [Chloroflexota bacterium]
MRIFGYEYAVREDVEINNRGLQGICDSDKHEIVLAVGMSKQQKISVIIHEMVEAVLDHLGIDELEHRWVMVMETVIHMILIVNGVDLSPLLKGLDE